ncbi:MAG: efflux transporter outer membrane subunit [Bacteroidaceae bacterium]|nr:efflux transporter outer membrane subunit [Bacteroidaceae bacterium]
MKQLLYTIIVVLLTCGCSISKRCTQPEVELPTEIVAGMEADSMCMADLKWYDIFADSCLVELIELTIANNKDLLTAAARVEELEKLYRVAKSDYFPSLDADAYVDRETNDKSNSDPVAELEVSATLTLSWELDFFGRVRWNNRQALANYLKTVEGQRALQMILVADVAIAYFELMALDNELDIIARTLATREEDLNKAKLRFEGGLTSEIPYRQAIVEYATTASLIPDLRRKIETKENEISVLTGQMPTSIRRSAISRYKDTQLRPEVGIPSDLLRRRPDLRASEQSLKAAMAKAGYAWADRFPRFSISLQGGLENNSFEGFLSAPFTYMIGELTAPIFAFGKRKAKYEAAIKAYDAERYQYEKLVLQAFQEVNDATIAYTSANEKVELMTNLKESAQKYLNLAMFQHINGHINYINVLDAQRSYLNAEIDLSNAIRDEYIALIVLYKALGGGWN